MVQKYYGLPDGDGFIRKWLVSGPTLSKAGEVDRHMLVPPYYIALQVTASLGDNWQYYRCGNEHFVGISEDIGQSEKVELHAATELVADKSREITACVWSFAAVDMWLNSELVSKHSGPASGEMRKTEVRLSLNEGVNTVFIRAQNIGGDNMKEAFGVQLIGDTAGIQVSLPDPRGLAAKVAVGDDWLDSVEYTNSILKADNPPPYDITVTLDSGKELLWSGSESLEPEVAVKSLGFSLNGQTLLRKL